MKARITLIVALLIVAALALVTDFVLIWRLLYFLVLLTVAGLSWALINRQGLRGEATKLSPHCTAGESIEQDVMVTNRSILPKLLIEAKENGSMPGQQNMSAFNIKSRSTHVWRSTTTCRRRGRYQAGSHTLTAGDPFGLFPFHLTIGEIQDVLVYPATNELPYFSPLSRNETGYNPNRWLNIGTSPDASRIREYATGDSYNRIHWPATAHAQQLMVKVFDPYRSNKAAKTIWVAVDMHRPDHRGDGLESTEEYCVTIAASIVKKYIEQGLAVGLLAAGESTHVFPPEPGEQHMWRLMESLAVMRATGTIPLDEMVTAEQKRFTRESFLVVVTPSSDFKTDVSLRHIIGRGTATTAILVDQMSFGGAGGAAPVAHRLYSSGAQVYVVKRGDQLATALDSRASIMK